MLDELDPRDGPTKEFLSHHEVMGRGKTAGKIKKDRLLIMVLAGDITPAEYDAGDRFAQAYNVSERGLGSSSDYQRVGGGGGDGREWMVDMATLLRDANNALNTAHGFVGALPPGRVMAELCANDASFKDLGRQTGIPEERVRTRVAKMLQTLARFFEERDRRAGISVTPGTIDQIKKRRDPEDDVA